MKRDIILDELVIEEATKLKQHATKDELDRLTHKDLAGDNRYKCIYGQMTGECVTPRALELIKLCANRVYQTNKNTNMGGYKLNGSPTEQDIDAGIRLSYFVSPIEKFLFKYQPYGYSPKSRKVKKLLAFLKDKTKELKFDK